MNPRAALSVIAAALLWSSAGWIGDGVVSGFGPLALAEARLLIGGGALLAWLGPRAALASVRALPRAALAAAALAMAAFQWGFFAAVSKIGAGAGVLLCAGLGPVAAAAFECIETRRRPWTAWWLSATLLAAAAIWIARTSDDAALGALTALGAGASYALYVRVTARLERAAPAGAGGIMTTAAALLGAGALLAPAAVHSTRPAFDAASLLALAYLGLVATALAYALFVAALRRLSARQVLTLLCAQPVAAAIGELATTRAPGHPMAWGPMLLAGAAVLALSLFPRPEPSSRPPAGTGPRNGSCPQCP